MTSTKRTTGLASLSLAVLLTVLMGTPALAHGTDVQPVSRRAPAAGAANTKTEATPAAAAATAPTPTPAKNIYAARESKDLEKFRGGDVVIIGSTTVLVVLLDVLLIVDVS
jgi:hypothetical protein